MYIFVIRDNLAIDGDYVIYHCFISSRQESGCKSQNWLTIVERYKTYFNNIPYKKNAL